jgi:serine/threonine-protein kinase HipA
MHANSTDPHALLAAIGRDCAGAQQFLPDGTDADTPFRISLAGAREKTALLHW